MIGKSYGACHCGDVAITLETARQPKELLPREPFHVSHFAGEFVAIADPGGCLTLTFPTSHRGAWRQVSMPSRYYYCDRCDMCVVIAVSVGRKRFAIANLKCMFDRKLFTGARIATWFYGEPPAVQLKRAAYSWTPLFVKRQSVQDASPR